MFLVSLENGATRYTQMCAVAISRISACSGLKLKFFFRCDVEYEVEVFSPFCNFKHVWLSSVQHSDSFLKNFWQFFEI